jgi:hypothetical protein
MLFVATGVPLAAGPDPRVDEPSTSMRMTLVVIGHGISAVAGPEAHATVAPARGLTRSAT